MYCVKCGSKIEDGFKFCPNCGAEVIHMEDADENQVIGQNAVKVLNCAYRYCPENVDAEKQPSYTHDEIEKIADDIFWRNPKVSISNISKLQKRANVRADVAQGLLNERMKELKRGENKRICPKCGSDDIVYSRDSDRSTTISITEGIYHTSVKPGSLRCECLTCGKRWKA